MSDLKSALKPVIDAVNALRTEVTATNATVQEIYQLLNSIEKQNKAIDAMLVQGYRMPAGSRKTISRRGAKKIDEQVGEDEATDVTDVADVVEVDAEVDVTDEKTVDESEEKTADESEVSEPPKPKKTKAKPKAKPKSFNKLNYFKAQFKADESQFDSIFTPKVRKELDANEKLKGLSGAAAANTRITVYYTYLSKTKEGQKLLEDAKQAFLDE